MSDTFCFYMQLEISQPTGFSASCSKVRSYFCQVSVSCCFSEYLPTSDVTSCTDGPAMIQNEPPIKEKYFVLGNAIMIPKW